VDLLPRHHAAAGELKHTEKRNSIMSQPFTPDLRKELKTAPVEPLLPIEKKLIAWSLSLGLVLLVVLAAINHFWPVTP
jgi:hypothetical protein